MIRKLTLFWVCLFLLSFHSLFPINNQQTLLPSEEEQKAFLLADDTIKLEIFKKLYVLENSTFENTGIKIDFPILSIFTLTNGQVLFTEQKPIHIFIGDIEYNLDYEVSIKPNVAVSVSGNNDYVQYWIYAGIGVTSLVIGFLIGGNFK